MYKISKNTIIMIITFNIILAAIALIRDVALASFLGTSAHADAILLAFFIPDIIGNNLFAAAIGITCVPVFTEIYINKSRQRFNQSVKSITLVLWLMCLILTIISFVFREVIIEAIGKGMTPQMKAISVDLFTIMLPTMLIFPLVTIGSSISNINNNFKIPAFAPVLFNLAFLSGIIGCFVFNIQKDKAVYGIAYSITAGVFLMFILIWANIKKRGWVKFFNKEKILWVSSEMQSFFKMFAPYAMVLFAYQGVLYVEKYLASMLETGTIAGLNYAYRISQIPLWIFVAALTTFSFPSISKLNETKQHDELKRSVLKFLKLTLVIILPLTIIIQILRVPIISILFRGGEFDADSINITAGILSGYALAIIGQSIFMISIRFFMAIRHMKIPMLVVVFSSVVNIISDFILVKFYGSAGLGYGAAIGSVCNGTLLLIFLNRKLELNIMKKARKLGEIAAANLSVIIIVLIFSKIWMWVDMQHKTYLNLTFGAVVFIACISAYLASLQYLKIYEIRNSIKLRMEKKVI
ncbi:MAG: murein biosynthesis integral membrane protein MurJ [Saccharofermentanales bacterium]